MKRSPYPVVAAVLTVFALVLPKSALASAPPGWIIAGSAPTHYEFSVGTASPVKRSRSASITAKPNAPNHGFGTLMQMIAANDYRGHRVKFSGYLSTREAERAQMWMRVDGPGHQVLAFENMNSRPITGTTGWKRYDIVLDVPKNSVDIAFGFFLAGTGSVSAADFKLQKVGASTPTTSQIPILPRKPINLDFTQ